MEKKMPKAHSMVYSLLERREKKWLSQQDLMNSIPFLGKTKHDDEHYNSSDTTKRRIRQIIRELRVDFGKPIISSSKGYRIVASKEEADEYIERLERTAKAQIISHTETYDSMKKVLAEFKVKSSYFEGKQAELFGANDYPVRSDEGH